VVTEESALISDDRKGTKSHHRNGSEAIMNIEQKRYENIHGNLSIYVIKNERIVFIRSCYHDCYYKISK
jgi:hypothetical protein